jgi:hypothetical protein
VQRAARQTDDDQHVGLPGGDARVEGDADPGHEVPDPARGYRPSWVPASAVAVARRQPAAHGQGSRSRRGPTPAWPEHHDAGDHEPVPEDGHPPPARPVAQVLVAEQAGQLGGEGSGVALGHDEASTASQRVPV